MRLQGLYICPNENGLCPRYSSFSVRRGPLGAQLSLEPARALSRVQALDPCFELSWEQIPHSLIDLLRIWCRRTIRIWREPHLWKLKPESRNERRQLSGVGDSM